MTYELTDEGLRTSDPVIGAMFLGEEFEHDTWFTGIRDDGVNQGKLISRFTLTDCVGKKSYFFQLIIPYPLVAEAIKPVKGEMAFLFGSVKDSELPIYIHTTTRNPRTEYVAKCAVNPITTGKTCGQLRELIERVTE